MLLFSQRLKIAEEAVLYLQATGLSADLRSPLNIVTALVRLGYIDGLKRKNVDEIKPEPGPIIYRQEQGGGS